MKRIKVKDIKKLIKNLPSNAYFDIRYLHQIEIGKNNKLAWLNIIN